MLLTSEHRFCTHPVRLKLRPRVNACSRAEKSKQGAEKAIILNDLKYFLAKITQCVHCERLRKVLI